MGGGWLFLFDIQMRTLEINREFHVLIIAVLLQMNESQDASKPLTLQL